MKKNRLKKTLAILLSVVMAQGIVSTTTASTLAVDTQIVESQTSNESDWRYWNEEDHICLTYYIGTDEEVVVPSNFKGLPVTEIQESFWSVAGVKKVILPESITRIGYMSFVDCVDLEEVNIPKTVTAIESQAFADCKKLKCNLVIPNGISTLEYCTFSCINNVPSVLVPDSVTSIDKYTFFLNDGPVVYYSSKNTAMKEFAEQYGGTNYLKDYKEFALDKTSMNIEVEEEYTLTSNLNSEDVIEKCTWSTSNKNVATVDQNGKVTGINNGTTTITMTTENGLTASCKVVVGAEPENVTLNKTALVLNLGVNYTLKTTLTPSNSATFYTWTSSDENVATVSDSGKIITVGKGTATITVTTANGKTASCEVRVKTLAKSIAIDRTSLTLRPEQVWKLKATTIPVTTDVKCKWTSSDESVAKVNIFGNITAVGVGTATITAITTNGKKASCEVKVIETPTVAKMNRTNKVIEIGNSYSLNQYPTLKCYTWTSSDESVVTVNGYGNITALKSGTAVITAIAPNGTQTTCEVKVVRSLN